MKFVQEQRSRRADFFAVIYIFGYKPLTLEVCIITACIAGDCWLARGEGPLELGPLLDGQPDVFLVNLECALSAGPRRKRRSVLPLDPDRLLELKAASNTICVLANNHVSDYGEEGLLATIEAVRRAGLSFVGAGSNLAEARKPCIVTLAGRRIAVLAYADTRPHVGAVAATGSTAGVAPLERELMLTDLRRIAPSVQDVWMFVHWGREYVRYPEPEQRDMARELSEAGATLIVGIHPHVLQGCEMFNGASTYYSLGNFVFPPILLSDGPVLRWHAESRKGISLRGTVEGSGWKWQPVPHIVSPEGKPQPPSAVQRDRIFRQLEQLSRPLQTGYQKRFSLLLRRELALKNLRRIQMMSWGERMRLVPRVVRTVLNH